MLNKSKQTASVRKGRLGGSGLYLLIIAYLYMVYATVSRLRLKQTTVTMRVGIAVCFGLNIDITETRKLLELARLTLNNDAECLAYEFVITNFKDCPLFEKNDILVKFGIDPIGTRSADD